MTLAEVYSSIQNPMEKLDIIDKILDAYLDCGSFYGNIVKYDFKENNKKVVNRYYKAQKDAFYKYLFEEWKAAIIYAAGRNIKNYSYKKEVKLLTRYLRTKAPQTAEEILKILNGEDTDRDDVKEALDLFRWDRSSLSSSWNHVDSRAIYAKTHSQIEVNHRLYINCDSDIVYLIALDFMKKCKQRKLKFYYKFDVNADRDEVFVVYSNTENLARYIEILEEIKNEYGLDDCLHEPPLLTGKINDWIGYGAEPYINGKKFSFNSFREKHLRKCIHNGVGSWIRNNPYSEIFVDGKMMYYYEYLIREFIEYIKNKCRNNRNYSNYSIYTEDVLCSKGFEYKIISSLRNIIDDILNYFEYEEEFEEIDINYMGVNINLSKSDLDRIFNLQLRLLMNCKENFRDDLKNRIKEASKKFGISSNYAIDEFTTRLFDDYIEKEQEKSVIENSPKLRTKRRVWSPMTDKKTDRLRKRFQLI